MKLMDAVTADSAIFLNLNEFGEELTIDGLSTVGIWDDTTTLPVSRDSSGISDVNSLGLAADERVLYVYTPESIPTGLQSLGMEGIPTPVTDQRLEIDGEYWIVAPGAIAQGGVLTLKLSRVYA